MSKIITISAFIVIIYGCYKKPSKIDYASKYDYSFTKEDSIAIEGFQTQDIEMLKMNFESYSDSIELTNDSLIIYKADTIKKFKKDEFSIGSYYDESRNEIIWYLYDYKGIIKDFRKYSNNKLRLKKVNRNGVMKLTYIYLYTPDF